MKRLCCFLILMFYGLLATAAEEMHSSTKLSASWLTVKENPSPTHVPRWMRAFGDRLHATWSQGQNELYIPTYAWHNRMQYSKQRVHTFNENPWGGGLGKSYYDEQGNWNALYAFAFLDSHKNVEPVVGYAYLKVHHFTDLFSIGGGVAVLVTARPDIFHNIPFPGALPWVSINYQRLSFSGTYIPGAKGAGNVLFLMTKYILDAPVAT